MAIVDMKRGDAYIVRAYRGEDLIFQRGNPYIETIDSYQEGTHDSDYTNSVYIYVDDVELMYNWRYEAEVSGLVALPLERIWSFLGGSGVDASYFLDSWKYGLYFGYEERSVDGVRTGYEILTNINSIDSRGLSRCTEKKQSITAGSKHVISLKLDSIPEMHYGDNPYQATTGGFFMLGTRNYTTGKGWNAYRQSGSFYKDKGRIYRISLYDESNVLIHNYIPKIVDGHKGMLDTVINKFYACSDDTKFNIGLG